MTTSRTATLMHEAWDQIRAAVTEGLKAGEGPKLEKLVTMSAVSSTLTDHISLRWGTPSGDHQLEVRPLEAIVDDVHELVSSCRLELGDRARLVDSSIILRLTEWGTKVRKAESGWVLGRLIARAETQDLLSVDFLKSLADGSAAAPSTGIDLTRHRLVLGRKHKALEAACEEHGIEVVVTADVLGDVEALLYPIDRCAVGRLDDFVLSWEPSRPEAVELTLASRIKLIGLDPSGGSVGWRFAALENSTASEPGPPTTSGGEREEA